MGVSELTWKLVMCMLRYNNPFRYNANKYEFGYDLKIVCNTDNCYTQGFVLRDLIK